MSAMLSEKKTEEKFCNCRNSKCMKLYCQCFAARIQCGKNCHCIDCHNHSHSDHQKHFKDYINNSDRKQLFNREADSKQHKGCACRKSGCTKKYCECYQSGLLCRDICKCIDCQNNQSLSNKKVISQLKRSTSNNSAGNNKTVSLYPIILTQDNKHMNQILIDQNPLRIKDDWIEQTAENLYKKAQGGSVTDVIENLLGILSDLQKQVLQEKRQNDSNVIVAQQDSEQMQDQNQQKIKKQHNQEKKSFIEGNHESQSDMIEQVDAISPISYQNLQKEDRMEEDDEEQI